MHVLPRSLALAPLLGLALANAPAQAAEPDSRITRVVVYPGSATVTRTQTVAAGAQDAVFDCLPGDLDAASLQAQGGGTLQVGDLHVDVTPHSELGERCPSPLETSIRGLEDKIAALDAESGAVDVTEGYLKSFAEAGKEGKPTSAEQIQAVVQALSTASENTLKRKHQIERQRDALERELKPLLAQRDRTNGAEQRVTRVRVALAAPQAGDLKLAYRVPGPSWQPSYRASLDSKTDSLRLERLAEVRQDTGEDWDGVALTLSTGQPTAATQAPLPLPWRVGIRPPQPVVMASAAMPPPAPAPQAEMTMKRSADAAAAPAFDVSVFQGSYATEFKAPQPVTVRSGAGGVALALQSEEVAAQLKVRTTPARDAAAYLVADFKMPEGVWPAGSVGLYRDGAFVGKGQLNAERVARDGLAFGRDERVQVHVERPEQQKATKGLIGSRNQRTDERRYTVKNLHQRAIALQVLDAAPVSDNEDVRVESSFEPAPTTQAWHDDRGAVAWEQELAAGAEQKFRATYVITWPKDAHLSERH